MSKNDYKQSWTRSCSWYFYSLNCEWRWTTVIDREQPWSTVNNHKQSGMTGNNCQQEVILGKIVCSHSPSNGLLHVGNDCELLWTTTTNNFKQPKTTTNDYEREVVLNIFVSSYLEMIVNDYKQTWKLWTTVIDYNWSWTTLNNCEQEVGLNKVACGRSYKKTSFQLGPWTIVYNHERPQTISNDQNRL